MLAQMTESSLRGLKKGVISLEVNHVSDDVYIQRVLSHQWGGGGTRSKGLKRLKKLVLIPATLTVSALISSSDNNRTANTLL